MKVMIYRNLTKGCWSVKNLSTNKVVMHMDELFLTDCEFRVSESGRQRVIRERKKYVHAGVRGILCDPHFFFDEPCQVRYNPYKNETFVTDDNLPVKTSKYAFFRNDGKVFAQNLNEAA